MIQNDHENLSTVQKIIVDAGYTGEKFASAIKKIINAGLHFLTVENQRFKNMQKSNPFLIQFKNAQESMEWHKKQVAKEKEKFKNYLLSLQKNKDSKVSKNDLANDNNISNSYQSTNYQQRQLDIKKITEELDEPIFS